MRFIVSYDISNSKLRNKLVRILEKYGERVQYSVFEFDLNRSMYLNLLSELKINGFLRKNKDVKIFIYKLTPSLVRRIKRIGYKPTIDSKYIII